MKICPVGVGTEGNRGRDGLKERKRVRERKWQQGHGREEPKNKAVAGKQEFMGSVV